MDVIQAARQIRDKQPDIRIIIITGNPDWRDRILEIEELGCGFLLKPVREEDLQQVLRDASLDNLNVEAYKSDNNLSDQNNEKKEEKGIKSLSETIRRIISEEEYKLGADVIAIFHINISTYEVNLIASNIDLIKEYEREKHNLIYSPIKDVILGESDSIEIDAQSDYAKRRFKNLLPLLSFRSFLGLPINVGGYIDYGLFYFHNEPGKFNRSLLPKTSLIAELIGTKIEKKLLEDQLAMSQKLVFIGEMSYSSRHEIGNILEPMCADIDSLKNNVDNISSGKIEPSNKDFIENFNSKIRNIYTIKNSILDSLNLFQRLIDDKISIEKENVNAIVSFAIQLLTPEANEKNVKLETELDENIPEIMISRTKLQYIFINLLLNAIQWAKIYRGNGGKVIIKTLYEKGNHNMIRVLFIDNGPGIHRRDWEKIFEPLITTRKGGTGMGLFICQSLARDIEAEVSVEKSLIFIGTTFCVNITFKGGDNAS